MAGQEHIDDKPFHEDGETTVRFSPGNLDLDDTVLLAIDPGDTGMDKRLELADVQVSPSSTGGIIVITVFPVALRAAEPTFRILLEGDMDSLPFHLKPHIHPFQGEDRPSIC